MSHFLLCLCIVIALALVYFSGFSILLAIVLRSLPYGLIAILVLILSILTVRHLYFQHL